MFRPRSYTALALLVLVLFGAARPAFGQAVAPWEAAQQVRQRLFAAQRAATAAPADARQLVAQAHAAYRATLEAPIQAAAPAMAALLDQQLAAAESAAAAGDARALAAARSRVWAGLLGGSQAVVERAIAGGDGATARSWLLLREFRTATRFARPGADATLAVEGLLAGQRTADDALAAVRADMLDTYQAQLLDALADADQALSRRFGARQAEQAGLAAGYFAILAPIYGEQRGAEARKEIEARFEGLVTAAVGGDEAAFTEARGAIDGALKGFRAAPLSAAEQARRAGQLLRYIALVPVEYTRGVRDGVVIKDIEIQEALTFRDGAQAAFADLEGTLAERDAAATARVAALLRETERQIRATEPPAAVEASVAEIGKLLGATMPAEWQNLNAASDFDVIGSVLDQVEAAVAQGQYELAESARLEAYAVLDSGPEQKLRGFAPDLGTRIESLFWQGERDQEGLALLLARRASPAEVKQLRTQLDAALAEGQAALNDAKTAHVAVAGNAAIIVFREGLEAVLILASLTASMRVATMRRFRKPVVLGSVLAFVASGLTWLLAHGLLRALSQYGERLEAVVSLIAIAVLLLITNWFFHKVYWTGWIASFHSQKRRLIGGAAGQWLGLVVLGFTSIYREGFETVLFLQALVLDAGTLVVLQGVALGLLGVAVVGVITFVLQAKLPYKKMLIVTGVMIGAVLLTMVGSTAHVMQAVGWLPLTPINGLYLPYWMGLWFGLYATWEGVGLQVASAVFVIGSYIWAERINHRKQDTAVTRTGAEGVERPLAAAEQ